MLKVCYPRFQYECLLTDGFCAGVSLITQGLYALVFCTRYLDIFSEQSAWNFIFKIFYISSSFYIIGAMQWIFPRTRERELSWKVGAGVFGLSLVLSPFAMLIFESYWSFRVVSLTSQESLVTAGSTAANVIPIVALGL